MYKTKILVVGFVLVACNVVIASLLFAIPAREVATIVQEPLERATTTLEARATASTSQQMSDRNDESRTSSQPSPDLGKGAPPPTGGGGREGVLAPRTATTTVQTPGEVADSSAPIRIPILATGTVLNAMRAYDDTSDTFAFGGKEHIGIGFFVTEINGKKEGDGYYWIVYMNGKTADLGASQQKVVPDDVVEWRYEKGYNSS